MLPHPPHPHPSPWQGMPLRGLASLGASLCMGALVGLASGHWWGSVLDATLIGLACWLCVDGSRGWVSGWRWRRMGMAPTQTGPAPDGSFQHWPGWPWVLGCVVLGAGVGVWWGGQVAAWLGQHLGLTSGLPNLMARWGHESALLPAVVLSSLGVALWISHHFYTREQMAWAQQHAEAAHRLAAESQLRLLQAQLEPHMLFNTLANLRALIQLDPAQALHMLDQLIGFLRATLSASRRPSHTLAEEFARLSDYLSLMQVRMGARLRTQLHLPEALHNCLVPPLLLQPLVENAIVHGLEPQLEGGLLRVSAQVQGELVCIQVHDDGLGLKAGPSQVDPAPHGASGFGLQQVRERLRTTWGGAASLTLANAPGGGTLVTLLLPRHVQPPADANTAANAAADAAADAATHTHAP